MSKVKTAHLVVYNSYQIDSLIAKIEELRLQLDTIKEKSAKQKITDFFFCLIDERIYLENSIIQLQSSLYMQRSMINFLRYYVKQEFVDISDVPNLYAPDFYKFCAENNLTC